MKADAPSWMRTLRKIDDYRWEIPTTYKPGMRVPGLIFASEQMLRQIAEEQALEQVANVATLPGIVKYSLAMPDIHWGYGFPVGGVAAFDVEEGIISPGAVGYDVNCLGGDSLVLHELGFQRRIADFENHWLDEQIKCVNPHVEVRNTEIAGFLKQVRASHPLSKVITESGRQIRATSDHPFLTPSGMVWLRDLVPGSLVSVYSFEGVPYEALSDELLVTSDDVARNYPGSANGLVQILRILQDKKLLPFTTRHPSLPYFVKLMGFLQGDGSLQFLRNGGAQVALYAEPNDLEGLRRDIFKTGFVPSRIYSRERSHRIKTRYGEQVFRHTEHCVYVRSAALLTLLKCLGAVIGNKAAQDFALPTWLDRAPRWMKRLYIAALFGAELTTPKTFTKHPYNFYGPVLSVNKHLPYLNSGRRFLDKIREWLAQFEVESAMITTRSEYVTIGGQLSIRLRLQISSRPENLVNLWTRVGFEYNSKKQFLGNVAAHYLKLKSLVVDERKKSIDSAQALSAQGLGPKAIAAAIASRYVSPSFVGRSLQGRPRLGVRIGKNFPDFPTFLKEGTQRLGETGQVWDRIIAIEALPFVSPVYDFTVKDRHHNFIANGFVVSNCGVRVIRTALTEDEVRPQLERLVDVLYSDVPAGVGSTGRVRLDRATVDRVLKRGAGWAVEEGYGWREDLEVIEAGGAFTAADPDKVSQQAKDRGRGQVGTLGSGNHFVEVQVVDQVFDQAAAEAMELEPGEVVVFIHSGSRGLGHQVCTDYLRVAERANNQKYHIDLVDRQLACVPFNSPEGQDYFGAMCAAANFAWANRQLMTHWAREAFARVFQKPAEHLGMRLVYDVAHNIAKLEEYDVDGHRRPLVVHRKGATRAFPPGHPEIPARYRNIGQPVLIPGDMGRYSFIAVGTPIAMQISFGSTCHGAGRVLGRKAAVRALAGKDVAGDLRARGIIVRAQDRSLLPEEAPEAYKDVADVVGVCHNAGISKRVVRTRPLGVVKG